MAIECDRYGFFNGIYGLEQSNWANYWRGIIPDGVLAQPDGKPQPTPPMEVYVPTQGMGMSVYVRPGQAMVDNHRVWLTTQKTLSIAKHGSRPRIDMVVLRVTYGNTGKSIVELDVKTGAEATSPEAPTLVTNTGGTYELALARITIGAGTTNIYPADITDMRYVYKLGNDSVTTFTTTTSNNKTTATVNCVNDIEYRCATALHSIIINLPSNPNDTFITGVCFTANASFSGVTFRKGGTNTDVKVIGDSLTMNSKRYNLIIWWDSGFNQYWCASKGVAAYE